MTQRHPLDVLLAAVMLDSTPRTLVCCGCDGTTVHHFARDDWDRTSLVRWYGCEVCGMLRSVDSVPLHEDQDVDPFDATHTDLGVGG